MAKFTATPLASSYGSVSAINANLAALETAIQNTVSRDGSSPNTMSASLDMNSNSIINVSSIVATDITVAGTSLATQVAAAALSASNASASEVAAAASANAAALSASSTNLPAGPLTAGNMLRVKGDATGYEEQTVAQVKTNLAINNVDNTSDANKPISTATQTALNAKIDETAPTGSAVLPSGTTLERDALPATGYTRFNTDYGKPEVYNGSAWSGLGGADGNGGDAVFYVNDSTVDNAYTVPTNKNAMCAGPITFNAAVTVNTGSRLTIV